MALAPDFPSTEVRSLAPLRESRELVAQLAASQLFSNFERSYTAASGLPLSIRPLESFQMPAHCSDRENPFCALMAGNRKGCVACLQTQCELERQAKDGVATARCFAGLSDSMLPIRMGTRVIGYLQTGQVSLQDPETPAYPQARQELAARSIEVDDRLAEAAYSKSRRMDRQQYEGFLGMLGQFANALAEAANALALQSRRGKENGIVGRALAYLEQHYQRKISLSAIARVSGASERHFCKVFRQETGLTFVSYLNRFRVEKAKKGLRETRLQVSEIAFQVGFDSIAQFNRTFKRYAGDSPRGYRSAATA